MKLTDEKIVGLAIVLIVAVSLPTWYWYRYLSGRESDFDLIFKYGVARPGHDPKNVLDTVRGTYTRDMVSDPPITVKLRLTEDELGMIHQKMIEIDFFNYPPVFCIHVPPGEPYGMSTPFTSYSFKVLSHGDVVKELWWGDAIDYEDEKAENLRELIRLIQEIIESKPEYQSLPKPHGAYA